MKHFATIRKPIYVASLTASCQAFPFTRDLINLFKEKHPEYKDCETDSIYQNGTWVIHFYHECAIDFVE